jgi:hypothetical protein
MPTAARFYANRNTSMLKLSKAQRAVLGAEIKEGSVVPTDMSARQIAGRAASLLRFHHS